MKAFTRGETRLNSAYGFTFLYASALTAPLVRQAIDDWGGDPQDGWPSFAFSNHDAPRAASRFSAKPSEHPAVARLCLLLLLSLRGNAFIYQGEELGLPQAEVPFERLQDPEAIANWPATLGRDGARTPLPWRAGQPHAGFSTGEPWLPLDPRHQALAVDRQEEDPGSTLHYARAVIAFRRAHPALVSGELTLLPTADPVVAFERTLGGERLLCAFNLSREPAPFSRTDSDWRIAFAAGLETGAVPPALLPPLSGYVAVRG
jgi:alpha-glucosidase